VKRGKGMERKKGAGTVIFHSVSSEKKVDLPLRG